MASTSKSSGMKALVEQFCAITGSTQEIGHRMLEACDGNLEMAINMHVDSSGAENLNSLSASSSNNIPELSNINIPATIPLQPDEENVRAPIPQTRGILVEESYNFGLRGRRRTGRSVFDGFRDFQQEARQQEAQLFNLLPENHSKRKTLEDLFRPPIDLMHKGSFETARDAGQVMNKWLLVNIQNVQEFSCQALNRDVWSNAAVKSVLQEHFVFWQVYHDSEEGKRYMQFYKVVNFPYIAILDPRTGENMLIWHKVDALTFCDLVSGFLTEHPSLDGSAGSVGCCPPKKIQRTDSIVDASEELQLEAAIAASLAEAKNPPVQAVEVDSDDDLDSFQSDSETESSQSPQQKIDNIDHKKCKKTLNNSVSNALEAEDKNQSSSSNSIDSTTNDNKEWKNYLGQDDGITSNLMIRFPDGAKKQLTLPASSKLMAVVTYVISKGFDSDKYELITTFPRRKVSTLDPNMTLKEAGLFPQETVFVQER